MKKFSICLDGLPGEMFNNLLDNLRADYHISRSEARSALFKAFMTDSVKSAILVEMAAALRIEPDAGNCPSAPCCAYCAPDGRCEKLYEYDIEPVKCWAVAGQRSCDYYCDPADYCDAVDERIEPEDFRNYILSKLNTCSGD